MGNATGEHAAGTFSAGTVTFLLPGHWQHVRWLIFSKGASEGPDTETQTAIVAALPFTLTTTVTVNVISHSFTQWDSLSIRHVPGTFYSSGLNSKQGPCFPELAFSGGPWLIQPTRIVSLHPHQNPVRQEILSPFHRRRNETFSDSSCVSQRGLRS